MSRSHFYTSIARMSIVFFWVSIILILYQLPNYAYMFSTRKTLYVLAWPLSLDAQYLVDFEKKTGIALKITYFETAEELLSKVKATEGAGYDIIFPSDYTIKTLIKEGLLQKIDKQKLTFWHDLDQRLLHNYFDPENDFTIPFYWATYGIGLNKKVYGDAPPKTWGLLLDKQYNPQQIIMTSSAREAILTTALYLFGSIDSLKKLEAQEQVKQVLLQQKAWVDLYTEERVDELLVSENNNIGYGLSTDLTRAVCMNKDIIFILPEEGSFKVIDSIAIPKQSEHVDLAYTFINYMFQPEIIDHHIARYNMCSPITTNKKTPCYCPNDAEFAKLYFLTDIVSEERINNIWIDLLAN